MNVDPEPPIEEGEINPLDEIRWDKKVAKYVRRQTPHADQTDIIDLIEKIQHEVTVAERGVSKDQKTGQHWLYIRIKTYVILIRIDRQNKGTFDGIRSIDGDWVIADK